MKSLVLIFTILSLIASASTEEIKALNQQIKEQKQKVILIDRQHLNMELNYTANPHMDELAHELFKAKTDLAILIGKRNYLVGQNRTSNPPDKSCKKFFRLTKR